MIQILFKVISKNEFVIRIDKNYKTNKQDTKMVGFACEVDELPKFLPEAFEIINKFLNNE